MKSSITYPIAEFSSALLPKKVRRTVLRIVAAINLILLTSCGADKLLSQLGQDDSTPLALNYYVLEARIHDDRDSISEGDIRLPALSMPNSIIKHVPSMTDAHRQVILNTITENTTGKGTPLKVVVTLLDSYKEFSATWSSERETGFAHIQITFLDPESGRIIASCDSNGEVFIQSIDATQKRMEEIYRLAIKSVTKKCLKTINEGFSNPRTEEASS